MPESHMGGTSKSRPQPHTGMHAQAHAHTHAHGHIRAYMRKHTHTHMVACAREHESTLNTVTPILDSREKVDTTKVWIDILAYRCIHN